MKHLPTIYCDGHRVYAYCIRRVWFCARCGERGQGGDVSDPSPRYVVREIKGYGMESGRWPQQTTDFMVLDSWYGFAVVAYDRPRRGRLEHKRRAKMEAVAAEWNAEHDAWLAAG